MTVAALKLVVADSRGEPLRVFPRSHDRGRIEATPDWSSVIISSAFHGHMTVAALKPGSKSASGV